MAVVMQSFKTLFQVQAFWKPVTKHWKKCEKFQIIKTIYLVGKGMNSIFLKKSKCRRTTTSLVGLQKHIFSIKVR